MSRSHAGLCVAGERAELLGARSTMDGGNVILSVNVSSWGTARSLLLAQRTLISLVQEHKVACAVKAQEIRLLGGEVCGHPL